MNLFQLFLTRGGTFSEWQYYTPLSGDNLLTALVPRVNTSENRTVIQSSQGQGYTKNIDLVDHQVAVTEPAEEGQVIEAINPVSDYSIEATELPPLGNKVPGPEKGPKIQQLNNRKAKVLADMVKKAEAKSKKKILSKRKGIARCARCRATLTRRSTTTLSLASVCG